MKRWFGLLIALFLVMFAAVPVSAQGFERAGDHVCIGGTTTVGATETPDSVVLFGCGGRIQSGARVRKDIVSFGGNVVLEQGAQLGGDVVIFGGNADIAGQVGHRVTAFGGTVTLEPSSVVNNDVQVYGGFVDKKEGATVRGRFLGTGGTGSGFTYNPFVYGGLGSVGSYFLSVVRGLVTALALAALGALVIVFLPMQMNEVAVTAQRAPLPSLGIGCLTWIVLPPLALLFVVTCIGIPLAAILGILAVAAGVFGWIAIGTVLGERLLKGLKVSTIVPIIAMLVGLLILWLVTQVPILGWLIWVLVASLALGAVVLTRFGTRPYPPALATSTSIAPVTPPSPPVAPPPPAPPVPSGMTDGPTQ
jgi:hypothetical protein